jgi:hypothetical protein
MWHHVDLHVDTTLQPRQTLTSSPPSEPQILNSIKYYQGHKYKDIMILMPFAYLSLYIKNAGYTSITLLTSIFVLLSSTLYLSSLYIWSRWKRLLPTSSLKFEERIKHENTAHYKLSQWNAKYTETKRKSTWKNRRLDYLKCAQINKKPGISCR